MPPIQCPSCSKNLGVKESQAGKIGACPGCKHQFRIPADFASNTSIATRKPPQVDIDEDLEEYVEEEKSKPVRRPKRKKVAKAREGYDWGGLGFTLFVLGAGSFVLPAFGYQFKLLMLFGDATPFAGAGLAVVGFFLLVHSFTSGS